MADTVTVTKIFDGTRYCEYEFTNESDATGESLVKKIDLDNLVGDNGALTGGNRPTSLTLVSADYEIGGFNYVKIYWDRQAEDKLVLMIAGSGSVDYFPTGGKPDPSRDLGGTGDILLTTDGAVDGASYRIRIMFRKKY